MNRRDRRHWHAAAPLLVSCALLWLGGAGCSAPTPPRVPPAKERAAAWNRRGLSAEARGDRDGALAAFRESLKVNRSIEDDDGSAVARINLARVHRLAGDLRSARAEIDSALRLLPPDSPLFPESAFEKGKVSLAEGNLPEAEEWAKKSALAGKSASRGRRINLLARVLFLQGSEEEARALAGEALEANREAGERGEEANSLRLLGDIAAVRAEGAKAGDLYRQALSIDRETAVSGKIAADLRALGAVAGAQGDTAKALAFYARAADVSRNGDDPREAAAALLEMARIYEKTGAPDKASSALAEREKLLREANTE